MTFSFLNLAKTMIFKKLNRYLAIIKGNIVPKSKKNLNI